MQSHPTTLARFAIGLAVINVASCLLFDLREWLVYFDPWVVIAVVIPAFCVALPGLPFVWRIPHSQKSSVIDRGGVLFILCFWGLMETIWAVQFLIAGFCRDANWNFKWPSDASGAGIALLNRYNLSDWIWPQLLGLATPHYPLGRESFGIMLILLQLVVIPALAAQLLRSRLGRMSFSRLFVGAFIVQLLLALPMKIVLSVCFHVKYVVSFPEHFLNV